MSPRRPRDLVPEQPNPSHHTHCSAFAAAVAMYLDIYLPRPPNHGQTLLANAQTQWLSGEGSFSGPTAASRMAPRKRQLEGRVRAILLSAQYICWPPLIDKVEPVMKPQSSATRKTTPRAISSALPKRPTGILATMFSSTLGGTAESMSVSV